MKKIFSPPTTAGLLPLLLCLATLAFSQQKHEFGFVVKAGNYAIPSKKTVVSNYEITTTTITGKAGRAYIIGIWHSLALGSHIRLSGELLYRSSSFVNEEHIYSSWVFEGDYERSEQIQETSARSLSLPIKLHFSFKKHGKTSLAIGGGISRDFAVSIYEKTKWQYSPWPEASNSYDLRYTNWKAFANTYNLTAGVHYRIDPKTSLGLEYTFEKSTKPLKAYSNLPILCPDCDFYYMMLIPRPNMNSFSVFLRHNILD